MGVLYLRNIVRGEYCLYHSQLKQPFLLGKIKKYEVLSFKLLEGNKN